MKPMYKLLLTSVLLGSLVALPVMAQGPGPGPGPGPVPSPWVVNGNTISYPGGVVVGAPSGSAPVSGAMNVSNGYYVNGVKISGLPSTATGHLICNLTGSAAVPTDCSWNAFASLALGTAANSFPFFAGGVWGELATGVSVLNPGTGTLETILPVQTVIQTSYGFLTVDLFKETRRSNSGSAMTDTFPGVSATGLINGTRITYNNVDATATATITAGAGTTMSNGSGSETVGPGRSIQYVYDASVTQWRRTLNTGTALLGPNNLSDLSNIATARGNLIPSGTITNAQLVNSATTVNGQSCSLGGTCTITATAGTITVGTTTVTNGPGILFNTISGGVLSALSAVSNAVVSYNGTTLQASTTLPSGIAATNMSLTTPAIGVATGTSLALGGASLGSNGLAINGSELINTSADNTTGLFYNAGGNQRLTIGTDVSGNLLLRSGTGVDLRLGVGATTWLTINNSTGAITHAGATTFSGAITYGGATFNNTVTGATGGNLVGSNGPIFTGSPTLSTATATSINGLIITTTAGTLTIPNNAAAALILSGNFSTTLTATAATNSTLPAGTHTLAGLDVAQTWNALQGHNDNDFGLNGSTSGNLVLRAAAIAGSSVIRFPAGSTDFSATGGAGQYVKQVSSGAALTVGAIAAADLPLATNAAIGGMRGDTSTINCVAGVCSAVGSAASAVTLLTTTVTGGTSGDVVTITNSGCSGTTPCLAQLPVSSLATGSPYFSVHQATAQAITSSMSKITFDTVDLNVGGTVPWSTSNFNFNPKIAGTYRVCTSIIILGTIVAGNFNFVDISKNGLSGAGGTIVAEYQVNDFGTTGSSGSMGGCALVAMNGSTDTLEVDALSSATSPTIGNTNFKSTFSAHLVGP